MCDADRRKSAGQERQREQHIKEVYRNKPPKITEKYVKERHKNVLFRRILAHARSLFFIVEKSKKSLPCLLLLFPSAFIQQLFSDGNIRAVFVTVRIQRDRFRASLRQPARHFKYILSRKKKKCKRNYICSPSTSFAVSCTPLLASLRNFLKPTCALEQRAAMGLSG